MQEITFWSIIPKNVLMKKFICILAFSFCLAPAFCQNKVEHNLILGTGFIWETEGLNPVKGVFDGNVSFAYGLDILLASGWSVMPGIGLAGHISKTSYSGEVVPFAELFCLGKYRTRFSGHNVVLGLGPEFQFMANDGRYNDYTEGWHGWHFTAPKNWFPFQFAFKAQALMDITDRFYLGLEYNGGARQVYIPANIYLNSLRLCAGFRL